MQSMPLMYKHSRHHALAMTVALCMQLPVLVTESSGPLLLGPASPMAQAGPPTPLAVSTDRLLSRLQRTLRT